MHGWKKSIHDFFERLAPARVEGIEPLVDDWNRVVDEYEEPSTTWRTITVGDEEYRGRIEWRERDSGFLSKVFGGREALFAVFTKPDGSMEQSYDVHPAGHDPGPVLEAAAFDYHNDVS